MASRVHVPLEERHTDLEESLAFVGVDSNTL